jgi:hypothetical protein
MEHIDVIFYINLDARTDRKEHFLEEIRRLCLDEEKVIRIDAIKDAHGALGCTKSHIKALDAFMANSEWKTCIVFEDDFTFHNRSLQFNNELLRKFFTNFKGMLLLATNQGRFPAQITHVNEVKKVVYSQTTSGYCVTKDCVKEVYENFKKSGELLEKSRSGPQHALDIYWNQLTVPRYCFSPNMGYQYGCVSDIENRFVNYGC